MDKYGENVINRAIINMPAFSGYLYNTRNHLACNVAKYALSL